MKERRLEMIIRNGSKAGSLLVMILVLLCMFALAGCKEEKKSGSSTETSGTVQKEVNGGHDCYPYEEKYEYVPIEIPEVSLENGYLIYTQETEVDETIVDLYDAVLNNTMSYRDCHPIYEKDGTVSFSRIPSADDPDEMRYQEMIEYLTKTNEGLPYMLTKLTENKTQDVGCYLMQDDAEKEILAVGLEAELENSHGTIRMLVSENLGAVDHPEIQERIGQFRELAEAETVSWIGDVPVAVHFVYQTRLSNQTGVDEGRYIYYAYFQWNDMEYLVQFDTIYTVPGTNTNTAGVKQWTPERLRENFQNLLVENIMKEIKQG